MNDFVFLNQLPAIGPWLICAVAVVLGTILQRLSGAGFGMIAAPVMTLVAVDWVPGTVLLLGFIVGLGSVLGARDAVVVRDLPAGFAGRIIGSVLAASVATAIAGSTALPIVVACIVLFSVVLTLGGLKVPIRSSTLITAGIIGGFMGTLTGIGAPPMAILYSSTDARRSAATQNAFFGFGVSVSIIALMVFGLIKSPQFAFAVSLAPLIPLSIWMSRPLAKRFERSSIRPWALGLATLSAVLLLARNT